METKAKRPPSVWIAQIVLCLFLLIFAFNIYLKISGISFFGLNRREEGLERILIPIVLAVWSLVANLGLIFRHRFGRWLAAGFFVFIVGSSLYTLLQIVGRPNARREWGITAFIASTIEVPLLFLSFRLIFSKHVIAFFRKRAIEVTDPSVLLPPPPPTFNS